MIVGRNPLRVRIGDAIHTLAEEPARDGEFAIELDGTLVTGFRYDAGDRVFVRIAGQTFIIPRAQRAGAAANKDELRADMPGTVVRHHVKLGQRVAAGDPLVTVESMKLQVVIAADRDGIIKTLPFAERAAFDRGAVLVTLGDSP
ncbi:MAG: biotin/lipoyl-binding protein [Kofleriaceae bacterium]